ncbi:MAG: hypothetical protein ACLQFI_16890 [Methylocella sp.]
MLVNEGEIRSASIRFDRTGFWIAVAVGTLVSLAITGFVFGTNNNVFHLPIVAELYNEPQFAKDEFMQSLPYYASGPWILLRGSASYVDPYWTFFFLSVISRFLSLVGFLACARLLGIESRYEQLFFSLLISTTYLLRGPSFAGDGGLFINYFNQSEISNGLFLLVFYFALRRRIAVAMALVGVIFFVNAFFAVWTIFVLGTVLLFQILRGDLAWSQVILRCSIGFCIAGLFAAPVVVSILSNPDFGKSIVFDYVSFLNEYFPFHFLFGPNSLAQKIGLAFLTMIGLGAFILLGRPGRLWLFALLAVCAIYVVGIFAPYATHSPTILNLHLLRSSTLIHLLSALAVCSLATAWWFGEDRIRATVAAPILVVALTIPTDDSLRYPFILAVGLFLLVSAFTQHIETLSRHASGILGRQGSKVRIAVTMWFVCIISILVIEHRLKNQEDQAWINEWQTIGAWARANTPANAIFMTPIVSYIHRAKFTDKEVGGMADEIFEYASHRTGWVDFKKGAVVMWSPSYYHTWHGRVKEVSALESHQEKLDYARKNGIGFVIEVCNNSDREKVLFATQRICVYDASQSDIRQIRSE